MPAEWVRSSIDAGSGVQQATVQTRKSGGVCLSTDVHPIPVQTEEGRGAVQRIR